MIAPVTTGRGVALVLGALCLALGATLYRELDGASRPPVAAPAAAPAAAAPLPPEPAAAALPPLGAYADVVQRPLFAPTRRPPPPEAAQDLLGAAEGFALLGTVIADDRRSALIRYGRPPRLARLGEGQAVEGWTVRTILPDRVLLEHGATRRELTLRDRPGAPPPGVHPPVPRRD